MRRRRLEQEHWPGGSRVEYHAQQCGRKLQLRRIAPTTYFVSFVAPLGYTMAITQPILISVTSGQTTTVPSRKLIANGFANPTAGNISGVIFADANGNKKPDPGEGVAGAQITADSGTGTAVASVDSPTFKQTTTSGSDGSYLFSEMVPGAYSLTFEAPRDTNRSAARRSLSM